MTSNDIRDVLNLPTDGLGPRPSKKQKVSAPRPNLKGLAREVQNLGGDNPIAIVPEVSAYKKRRLANRKPAAKWEHRPFRNSAREDSSLILRHWKRKSDIASREANGDPPAAAAAAAEGENAEVAAIGNGGESEDKKEPEIEDSDFAKFNVKVDIPEYTEEQYNSHLQSNEWTKEETDYLLEVVKDYDLRWPLIWDRYEYSPRQPEDVEMNGTSTAVVSATKPRTMEDLKARYYKVAGTMMEVQTPRQYMTQAEWDLHTVMMTFNPESERQRKTHALNTMNRSKDEAKEEESLLIEVKRIMARAERFNEERRELYQRLDYDVAATDISAFQGSTGLTNLLGHLQSQSNARKRKPLTGTEGASPAVHGYNGQPSSAVSETAPSRRESIAAQAAGHRESIGAEKPTPAGNKKGQPPPERRKLTEYEEQIYGVSTHERLSSGPTFRCDKVNKLFIHKSGQQQLRIQNVLNELELPARLHIPTATVVAEYEKLVLAVTNLVEARKAKDKLDNEIKIEEAKRDERAKARAVLGQGDGAADDTDDKKAKEEANSDHAATGPSGDKSTATNGDTNGDSTEAPSAPDATAPAENGQTDGPAEPNGNGDAVDGEAEDQPTPLVKQEEGTGTRPGSSGGGNRTKRSASVLSGTSDKSTKRQRK
ncbi:swr complex subunit [Gnomoniopsis smithogilvyi]|uniref:SWR1-complex protein 4 n=1 Tax=Gnomoniopsis smithogilvyi TaxID=1191159 RepID=A0A9W8Z2K8_9PEZI|nr:swr complex subunit [Gnomoniopsis smithogilvyi]